MPEIIVLVDVVREVGNHLSGFGYFADEGDGNPSLKHSDGRELLFRIGNYGQENGRLIISGQFPRDGHRSVSPRAFDKDHQKVEFRTSITVAPDKLPERIASDITKRLLPDYDKAFANVVEQIKYAQEHRATGQSVAQRLGELLGTQPHAQDGDDEVSLYASATSPFYRIRVQGDSVRFEHFSCTPEQAEAIIRSVQPAKP